MESADSRNNKVTYKKIVYVNSFSAVECELTQTFGFREDTIKLRVKPVGTGDIKDVRLWIGFYRTSDRNFDDMFDYFDTTLNIAEGDSLVITKTSDMHPVISAEATEYFACDTNFIYSGIYYGQGFLKSADGTKLKNLRARFFINTEQQLQGQFESGTDVRYLNGLFIDAINVTGYLQKADKTNITDVKLNNIAFPSQSLPYDAIATCELLTPFSGYDSLALYLIKR